MQVLRAFAQPEEETRAGSSKQAQQGTLTSFVMAPHDQQRFIDHIVRAVITANILFNFMENEDLQAAARIAGVKLPGRKATSTVVLDRVVAEVEIANVEKLKIVKLFDASSDSWRKKFCDGGGAMQNFCVLLEYHAMQYDVMNVALERKNAEGIASILERMAAEMAGDEPDKLIGWLLDNTKANWSAMKQMQLRHPKWLLRGCLAHSMNVLIKDLCNFKPGRGQNARDNTFGLDWVDKVVMLSSKVSNFIQDSGIAKSMVCILFAFQSMLVCQCSWTYCVI